MTTRADWSASLAGLTVMVPSPDRSMRGAIVLYDEEEEVPDEAYTIPFGEANLTREGEDVTIVAMGRMVGFDNHVADAVAKDGIACTVIDPRTTSPLDEETILECAEETGRVVVVDEANPRCSMASDIAALIGQNAFGALKAPVKMVTPPHFRLESQVATSSGR